jgi:phage baseplate assembly protein W
MTDSTGLSADGGRTLTDWGHVEQSVRRILTTPLGTRVMRRDFGSRLFDFIDAKMTPRTALSMFSAAAEAIETWEPRFRVYGAKVVSTEVSGEIDLMLFGLYFPRGHLGDYTVVEDASIRTALSP